MVGCLCNSEIEGVRSCNQEIYQLTMDASEDEGCFFASIAYFFRKIITQTKTWHVQVQSLDAICNTDDIRVFSDIKWTPAKFSDLPEWLQSNEYLLQGYRPPLPSFLACLKSWFRIHTETVNIWSHVLAFMAFWIILIHNWFLSEYELRDKMVFSIYIVGFMVCFGMSTMFHTVSCHSESVSRSACICDYAGIVTAMLGAIYSCMVYVWWCRWHWTIFYCSLLSVMAYSLYQTMVRSSFSVPDGKKKRAIMSIISGCSGLLSVVHEVVVNGLPYVIETYPLKRMAAILAICLLAAALYSSRTPESIWPGKFDIWFHSHQLFHVMVAAAAFVGYHGLISLAEVRLTNTNYTICDAKLAFTYIVIPE